jgi:hypothetical protein
MNHAPNTAHYWVQGRPPSQRTCSIIRSVPPSKGLRDRGRYPRGSDMADNLSSWIGIEYVIEVLDDVRKRLVVGGKGAGVTLTADECKKVLFCLKNPPWPNSRPPDDGFSKQAAITAMARYCCDLESNGAALKNAVLDTAKHFRCSTSTVYAARRAPKFPYK